MVLLIRRTRMPRKSYKPEEIVAKLRQVDVLTSQGQSVAEAIRSIGVSEVTYYRWRQEFGGLKSDQIKRLKDLETENNRLRRAVVRRFTRNARVAVLGRKEKAPPSPAGLSVATQRKTNLRTPAP